MTKCKECTKVNDNLCPRKTPGKTKIIPCTPKSTHKRVVNVKKTLKKTPEEIWGDIPDKTKEDILSGTYGK